MYLLIDIDFEEKSIVARASRRGCGRGGRRPVTLGPGPGPGSYQPLSLRLAAELKPEAGNHRALSLPVEPVVDERFIYTRAGVTVRSRRLAPWHD